MERDRKDILRREIAQVIAWAPSGGLTLFAAAVEKNDRLYGEEAVKAATEQICKRFDTFLGKKYREENDPQRGLLVFAEGRFHQRSKLWVQQFRELGTQWGVLRNLADIPYFASTKETRLLQLADYVAHSIYLLYERRDAGLVRSILSRFPQESGIVHGLVHISNSRAGCECPPCASRRPPHTLGAWVITLPASATPSANTEPPTDRTPSG